jgi:hypothetical protein
MAVCRIHQGPPVLSPADRGDEVAAHPATIHSSPPANTNHPIRFRTIDVVPLYVLHPTHR